jgi:hypothetical protein
MRDLAGEEDEPAAIAAGEIRPTGIEYVGGVGNPEH